jgi:crossover junction endodeoxyribonuclease RuvC
MLGLRDALAVSGMYLGVDPGFTGALAIYSAETKQLIVQDMPILEIKGRKQIDLYALHYWIDIFARSIKLAMIEDVGAMVYTNKAGEVRGQGASSSFAFGRAAGSVQGIVAASMIPIILVKPEVWKCSLALSSDKNDSLMKARKVFPTYEEYFLRKKDDGRAEAALLAWMGARTRYAG